MTNRVSLDWKSAIATTFPNTLANAANMSFGGNSSVRRKYLSQGGVLERRIFPVVGYR